MLDFADKLVQPVIECQSEQAIVDQQWVSLITDVMTGSVVTNQLCLSANICS